MTSSTKIGIIDYDAGNLFSVVQSFRFISSSDQVYLLNSPDEIAQHKITHLVLPGQGSFGQCMHNLQQSGWSNFIQEWIAKDQPFFGICVGYQLLFEESEESPSTQGLAIFEGKVCQFQQKDNYKVPHMGWNTIHYTANKSVTFWQHIPDVTYMYFIHSYYPIAKERHYVQNTTNYANTFDAAIARGRTWGTQFHPEKSHHHGLQILRNFITI